MPNKTRSKFHWKSLLLPWIEPISAAVIGLVLYFLQMKDLADITWIVGLLFAFNNITTIRNIREEFNTVKGEFNTIHKLGEIIDLSHGCDVQAVGKILHLYLDIREAEFSPLKDDIVQLCITQLNGLAHDKVLEINGIEYYSWLMKMMQLCSQDELVLAFRPLPERSWLEQPAEKGYINENVKAANRGVKIERIFVSSKDRLRDRRNREVIHQLMNGGIVTYIVWLEELRIHNFVPMQEIEGGFVLFGNRVAITNTTLPPNKLQGIVTMNPEQLKHYQRLFEQLKLHARLANTDFFSELEGEAVP